MAFGSTPSDANNIPIGSVYVPGTGFKALQGGKVYTDASSNDSAPAVMALADGWKPTYSARMTGLVPGATPQDFFTITGSSTKTIRVTRLVCSGLATAATPIIMHVVMRSTANTAGTSTAPTLVPLDSNNAAASATVLGYTANPTAGTLIGAIYSTKLTLGIVTAATTDIPTDRLVLDWGVRAAQSPVLRGTGQVLALNLNGVTAISGWTFECAIEWSEE